MGVQNSDRQAWAAHRRAILDRLEPGQAMLLFGAHHHLRNGDAEYRYRQLSDLLYVCGWEDPEVAVLLRPDGDENFVMWVQPKDPEREVWTGIREGAEGAVANYGADHASTWDKLPSELGEKLLGVHTLYYAAARDPQQDGLVMRAIAGVRRKAERELFVPVPSAFVDPGRVLHELRLLKDEHELSLLREAARISSEAHAAAMKAARVGMHEYELEALIDYRFRAEGGNGPGYTTIVGGGAGACILHYITNREPLRAGEMVLIDAGCEYRNYTADITRTFPVDGVFTEAQKELYQLVLDVELACIEAVKPGICFRDIHDLAVRLLTEGMLRVGLLEGELEKLIEDKDYRRYYMHGTSHWLGMDVHDVGAYVGQGESRRLEPGMVFTIEPGLYVAPDDEQAPERFRGMGVRIEDDVLVTEDGVEVLTASCPKTIEEVEAACQA